MAGALPCCPGTHLVWLCVRMPVQACQDWRVLQCVEGLAHTSTKPGQGKHPVQPMPVVQLLRAVFPSACMYSTLCHSHNRTHRLSCTLPGCLLLAAHVWSSLYDMPLANTALWPSCAWGAFSCLPAVARACWAVGGFAVMYRPCVHCCEMWFEWWGIGGLFCFHAEGLFRG